MIVGLSACSHVHDNESRTAVAVVVIAALEAHIVATEMNAAAKSNENQCIVNQENTTTRDVTEFLGDYVVITPVIIFEYFAMLRACVGCWDCDEFDSTRRRRSGKAEEFEDSERAAVAGRQERCRIVAKSRHPV